jgi:NADH:ubiquinone oxidoreductase subunit D
VGSISPNDVLSAGATGPVARSAGVKKDIRFLRSETYAHYWFLSIQGYLGKRGDSYDRFLIRIREMYESLSIVFQVLTNLTSLSTGSVASLTSQDAGFFPFFNSLYSENFSRLNHNTKYTSMESLIGHFKHYSEGTRVPRGFVYKAVEAPKGEFGVSLISDGTSKPYRCKIRAPSYHHMQIMSRMAQGHYFADLVTILGSLDIVFGDVDR